MTDSTHTHMKDVDDDTVVAAAPIADTVDDASDRRKMAMKFFEDQNVVLVQMAEQQTKFMVSMGFQVNPAAAPPEPKAKKQRVSDNSVPSCSAVASRDPNISRSEEALSIHPSDGEEMDTDDVLGLTRGKASGNLSEDLEEDSDLDTGEAIMGSRFELMEKQVEEELGDPLSEELAKVNQKAWGQARLNADRKKELLRDLLVPSNCPAMRTPRLNVEIDIRLKENAATKDRAVYDRQVNTTKTAIPLESHR